MGKRNKKQKAKGKKQIPSPAQCTPPLYGGAGGIAINLRNFTKTSLNILNFCLFNFLKINFLHNF